MVIQTEQKNTWCLILKLSNQYFLLVCQQNKLEFAPLNVKQTKKEDLILLFHEGLFQSLSTL